jgi:hypothetical protein
MVYKVYGKKSSLKPSNWGEKEIRRNDLYLFWCLSTMDSRILSLKQFANLILGQSVGSLLISSSIKDWWKKEASIFIENDLGDNDYLNGNEFTITDIYLGLTLAHFYHAGILDTAPKKVQDYYHKKIKIRSGFKKAIEGTLFNFGIEKESKN